MGSEVFVVYKYVLGACDALFVYGICTSRYSANALRRKAAGFRQGSKWFDVDPATTPYATQVRILKVQADRLYSRGVLCPYRDGSEEVTV